MNISHSEYMNINQQRWIAERRGEFDYSDLLLDAYDSFDALEEKERHRPQSGNSHKQTGKDDLKPSIS
jgi:hypothetical protein